uniref:Uncharacterized protein n=1 Tax=Arundo donax TaxID=35708 RepID=A0A0A9EZI2_ARUDO
MYLLPNFTLHHLVSNSTIGLHSIMNVVHYFHHRILFYLLWARYSASSSSLQWVATLGGCWTEILCLSPTSSIVAPTSAPPASSPDMQDEEPSTTVVPKTSHNKST